MKVLFISYGLGVYGANTSLLNLIVILREKYGVTPYVLVRAKGDFTKRLDQLNISYFYIKFSGWIYSKNVRTGGYVKIFAKKLITIFKNLFYNYITYRKIQRKGISFSLIHSNTSVINIGCYLSKKLNTPHIFHIREFLEEDYNIHFIFGNKYSTRYINKYSDSIITNSNSVKTKFSRYLPESKIKVVHNGVDLRENSYIRDFSDLGSKKSVNFLIVGLISKGKNQMEALNAVKILKNIIGVDKLKLFIVGDGDKIYYNELVEYVVSNDLGKYIKFTGYLKNVGEFRKNADVAIICSKMEAFGRVTVEAMLSQMPVIGTNTGGTPEIIDHGETGFLYDYGNPKQLATYMKKFIDGKMLIQTMGIKGYKKACKEFTAEINASRIYDVYSSVIVKKN